MSFWKFWQKADAEEEEESEAPAVEMIDHKSGDDVNPLKQFALSSFTIEEITEELGKRSNIRYVLLWEDINSKKIMCAQGSTSEGEGLLNIFMGYKAGFDLSDITELLEGDDDESEAL